MKNILLLSLLSFLLFSCGKTDTDKTMTITGKVKGLKKGTLYLQHIPDSTLVIADSLQVDADGSFIFKTEVESPEIFYLYLNKKDNNKINDRITFFGEPGTITINTSWNTFDTNFRIEGSETQKKLEEYQKVISRFNTKNFGLMQSAASSGIASDSLKMDSIQKISDKNVQRLYAYALNFALNNRDSYIAPYIAINEVADANIIYLDSIYRSLSPAVASSKYGVALKKHLNQLHGK